MSHIVRPNHSPPPSGSRIDWTHPLARGLVGCYLMNEGAGGTAHDLARRGAGNGVLTNAPPWVNTRYGPATDHTAASVQSVNIAETTANHIGLSDFSMVWLCYPTIAADHTLYMDGREGAGGLDGFSLGRNFQTANMSLDINGATRRVFTFNCAPAGYAVNTWMHMGISVKRTRVAVGGIANLYRDGAEISNVGVDSAKNEDVGGTEPMKLGGGYVGAPATYNFEGLFVRYYLYHRYLTCNEQRALYYDPYAFIIRPGERRLAAIASAVIPVVPLNWAQYRRRRL